MKYNSNCINVFVDNIGDGNVWNPVQSHTETSTVMPSIYSTSQTSIEVPPMCSAISKIPDILDIYKEYYFLEWINNKKIGLKKKFEIY